MAVRPVMHIEVPYEGTQPLELDPSTSNIKVSAVRSLDWLLRNAQEEEIPRILTAAVLLWHAEAGSMGQCLDTAIVWERG